MKRLKAILTLVVALMLMSSATMKAQNKREFRGAWIQCVNGQYLGKSTQQIQAMLTRQLDELQKDGVNAIIFQVRAECDALYKSDLEPWSKFLTGVQGKAPSPYWDPLQWMIEQCHNRGMELHAWINPYRAKHSVTSYEQVSPKNIVKRRPDLCFQYGRLTLLNPGLQAAADYICEVAVDIVSRYDVDGFHIDDMTWTSVGASTTTRTLLFINLRNASFRIDRDCAKLAGSHAIATTQTAESAACFASAT